MKLIAQRVFACLFAALPFVALTATSSAATINYGDFSGTTVDYKQVTEGANSPGDVPPLFGAPTVTGDSIDFDPVGFSASAAGAAGNDVTDGNLKFDIVAKPTFAINTVRLTEAGDTTLAGFGNDQTLTNVSAAIFIDIKAVDGVGISSINYNTTMTFTPSGGSYKLGTDGGGGPIFNTIWNGVADIDINQILTDNNIPFKKGATSVTVNLDNTLLALSQAGTTAFIAKKDADGVTITTNLPEPSSVVLAFLGALGLGALRRR